MQGARIQVVLHQRPQFVLASVGFVAQARLVKVWVAKAIGLGQRMCGESCMPSDEKRMQIGVCPVFDPDESVCADGAAKSGRDRVEPCVVDAVGADLRFLGSLGAPSLRVARMTIAGA